MHMNAPEGIRSVFRGIGDVLSGSSSSHETRSTEGGPNYPPLRESGSNNQQHTFRSSTRSDSSDNTKRRGNSLAPDHETYNNPSPQVLDDSLTDGKRSEKKPDRRLNHGHDGSVANLKQKFEHSGGGQPPQERSSTDPNQNNEERLKPKRREQHFGVPESLERGPEIDPKRPPKQTMDQPKDFTSDPDPEATGQQPRYKNIVEDANYYRDKCRLLESENSQLRTSEWEWRATNERLKSLQLEINKLQESKGGYKSENEKLRRKLQEMKIHYSSENEKCWSEIDRQKSKFEALQASHIRSVNNVGTGLEPISDQEFETRFQALHDEVGVWSRKAFKQRGELCSPEQLEDILRQIITPRDHIQAISTLRLPRLVETIVWEYIERNILTVWFPSMPVKVLDHMNNLQGWIRAGDKSDGNGRSEYWRAYTISLLFQNSVVRQGLGRDEEGPAHLIALFYAVQTNPVQLEDKFYQTFKELLRSASELAAELRCQRGVYEVDQDIRIGDVYDDSKMTDVTFSTADLDDEEENTQKQAFVSCIIAKGVVRRPFPGSAEVEKQLSKARVLVRVHELGRPADC
ncbi:hypothetical protein K440DRAFT_661488 [Wilcoxina mikolae CBS 423.85]|nr:hypothetical protein K440DRAFT_661488 [Wilcoxina mikolae CBS 423.85]